MAQSFRDEVLHVSKSGKCPVFVVAAMQEEEALRAVPQGESFPPVSQLRDGQAIKIVFLFISLKYKLNLPHAAMVLQSARATGHGELNRGRSRVVVFGIRE
jgi:hypothetical protein